MTNRIHVRPARPDDAPLAAAVFRLSMERQAEYLFASDGRQTEIALMRLFSSNAGRFGFGLAFVAEWNHHPLGMMVSFPARDMTRLNLSVVKYLPRALGWKVFSFFARSLPIRVKEAEGDEYYVSNLAVLPPAQGQGLGKHLLLQADEQARSVGLTKCSLKVPLDNQSALRLYKRNGYEIVFTERDKNPIASYHRMVKILE